MVISLERQQCMREPGQPRFSPLSSAWMKPHNPPTHRSAQAKVFNWFSAPNTCAVHQSYTLKVVVLLNPVWEILSISLTQFSTMPQSLSWVRNCDHPILKTWLNLMWLDTHPAYIVLKPDQLPYHPILSLSLTQCLPYLYPEWEIVTTQSWKYDLI